MSDIKEKTSNKEKIANALVTVILILAILLCAYVTIQVMTESYVSIFGYSLFRVVTGSMEPTIPVGAVLLAKEVPIETLVEGDIICFQSLDSTMLGKIITHRIVDIFTNEAGVLMLQTKGDANPVSDFQFVTSQNLVGLVAYHTTKDNIGAAVLSFLTSGVGFMACLALPCLFIAGLILQDCVKNMQRELQLAMEELERKENEDIDPDFPYQYFTREEYEEMYQRIRLELMEELGLITREPEQPQQETYEQMCARLRAELMEELSNGGE